MFRGVYILLGLLILMSACRKPPVIRRTEIYGNVTHMGKNYPEQNAMVLAVAYYRKPGFSTLGPIVITKTVDSAVTDANGRYLMQFDMDANADSLIVSCHAAKVTSYKSVNPGKINANVDLTASFFLPVVVNKIHVINNDHPPLVVFYAGNPTDSAIINKNMDTSFYYNDYSVYFSSQSRNVYVNPFFNCYYDSAAVKKTNTYSYSNLPYADTISLNTVVDAATFTP